MTSINPGAGFEADDRAIGRQFPARTMEKALARIAGAKLDGASWSARHAPSTRPFDEGGLVSTRRIKLENEEEAAAALARIIDRDPGTKDARRRARSSQ